MIGVFDSGEGGLNTLGFLRQKLTRTNIIFLRDRKNSPYGKKSREELIEITERNIAALRNLGADRILIACCTASSLYGGIDVSLRENVIPILPPVAERARASAKGKIAVLATDFTVRSHAFSKALSGLSVTEIAAQPLVDAVESGERDGRLSELGRRKIESVLSALPKNCDTLILGCTHFSSIRSTVENAVRGLGVRSVIDAAEVGAEAMLAALGGHDEGLGLTYRLTS